MKEKKLVERELQKLLERTLQFENEVYDLANA